MNSSLMLAVLSSLQAPTVNPPLGVEGFLESSETLSYGAALPLRAAASGGAGYFFLRRGIVTPAGPRQEFWMVPGTSPHHPEWTRSWDLSGVPFPFLPGPWEQPSIALPSTPIGDRLVHVDLTGARFTEVATRTHVGSVALPAGAVWYEMLRACGDLDGDGWEETYFHAHDGWTLQAGVIDGQTLTTRWISARSPRYSPAPPMDSGFGAPTDLDGDGILDVVHSALYWNAGLGNPDLVVATLSGADGSTLWETAVPNLQVPNVYGGFAECMTGPDLDGDGHREIALHTWDAVVLLDGATGSVLWTTPLQPLIPQLPGNQTWIHPEIPLHWDHVPGRPGEYTVAIVIELQDVGPYLSDNYIILRFDPASGQWQSYDPMPEDLLPWSPVDPERPGPASAHDIQFIGDVDGDGFVEFAKLVPGAPTAPPPNGFYPPRIAFLGQPSLHAPRTVPAGSLLDLQVTVPSSPGHPVRMAVGADFAPLGGRTIQGWSTYLRLLLPAPGGPLITATLDSNGEAAFVLPIPATTGLIGHDLHLRGVVLDAATPGRIRTMTNPRMVTVTP